MDLIWVRCAILASTIWAIYTFRSLLFNPSVRRWIQPTLWSTSPCVDEKVLSRPRRDTNKEESSELTQIKDLFYQLHNLEETYNNVLPKVDSTLRNWISEALEDTLLKHTPDRGILAIDTYSRSNLDGFLQREHDSCMLRYEQYSQRRKAGGDRELFHTRDDASKYIRRLAPLRLVDGAWLAHISNANVPHSLRRVIQNLWQIMSEELGDGSLEKNHVHVYAQLVRETGVYFEPHTKEFLSPDLGMDDTYVWKAAVAQQLISILPDRYLPEILGFNVHFEGIAFETLVNCRELKELGFDPSYYLLHVSIDNNHSGHSAMAFEIVTEYLDHISHSNPDALQSTWNRVRAGYVLSSHLTTATNLIQAPPELNTFETTVLDIMTRKAPAAQKMHSLSPLRIGADPIDAWLSELPHLTNDPFRQTAFLRTLANTPCMIRKGSSKDSRLIREIRWGGKMFGAFTTSETASLCAWIDSLPPKLPPGVAYTSFIDLDPESILYDPKLDTQSWTYSFFQDTRNLDGALRGVEPVAPFSRSLPLPLSKEATLRKLFPLYFASLALFESFPSTPSRAATQAVSKIIRVLRAQHGLSTSIDGVGGIDEALRTDRVDLWDAGLHLAERAGLKGTDGSDRSGGEWAQELRSLAVRPWGNRGVLVGLGCAFVEMREGMVGFVDGEMRKRFADVVRIEKGALDGVLEDERGDEEWERVCRGYAVGRKIIEDFSR